MGLIDSIFNNYYIPPIVCSKTMNSDKSEKRVCIDGKQRLTSIRRFFEGEIFYRDPETNQKLYYKAPPGTKRAKLLPIHLRNIFKSKQMAFCEYDAVTPEQEREIFQRVQLGMALGPADRLPAINGAYADLVRELRLRVENTEGFSQFKSDSRGKDFQALAQIVYLMQNECGKSKDPSSTRLEAFLAKSGVDTSPLQVKVNLTIDCFIRIVQDPILARPLLARELVSMEFVMAVYLVSVYRTTLSDAQLSEAIRRMRDFTLKEIKKFNTDAFNKLGAFVLKEVPKMKLTEWFDSAHANEQSISTLSKISKTKNAQTAAPQRTTQTPAKRKATTDVEQEDEDDDECDTIPHRPRKKIAVQKQETGTPALETGGSQPVTPKPAPLNFIAKLEKRAASTSKARTTVKKVSPRKAATSTSVHAPTPAAFAAKPVIEQTATPSIKPTTPSVKPTQRDNIENSYTLMNTKKLARASSVASTASTSTLRPVATTKLSMPAPAASQLSTPAASPSIPFAVPQYAVDRSSSTIVSESVGLLTPRSVSDSSDRLLPLRLAKEAAEKKKRNSMSASTSSIVLPDLTGSAEGVSAAPKPALKDLKFNKSNFPAATPSPVIAYSMNEGNFFDFNALTGTFVPPIVTQGLPIQHPTVIPGAAEVRMNVQRSPSTDPRLRAQRRASETIESTNRLPTPPQSGLSPHLYNQQILPAPPHIHEQMLPTAGQKRRPDVSEEVVAQQPLQQTKRSRPSVQPAYPVPGDRNNR